MGKKGAGKSSSKGGKGPKAAPRCECDHPFQCNCGNRPERPSRGHKWYPEEQEWAGKGHKQKGGSGQTSSVAKVATLTTKGNTKIEQWQKLPSQLLADQCKRERRPPPKFKALDKQKPGAHKYRCIVQDAKASRRGGEHDMILIPAHPVKNEEQAREESALLALLHLTPAIPHERKLPEPYKTTWLSAVEGRKNGGGGGRTVAKNGPPKPATEASLVAQSGKAKMAIPSALMSSASTGVGASSSSYLTSGKSYSTASEKRKQADEKKRVRNARIARQEAIRQANRDHQVYMSAQTRRRIEAVLRGGVSEDALAMLAASDADGEDDDDPAMDEESDYEDEGKEEEDEIRHYVLGRLIQEGFARRQAKAAYAQLDTSNLVDDASNIDDRMDSFYEESLQWLCIHLNEDQLPEGFDPRGRTLDVVVAGNAKGKSGSAAMQKSRSGAKAMAKDVIDFAARFGLSDLEADLILQAAGNDINKGKSLLWTTICKAANFDPLSEVDMSIDGNNEVLEEELEALQAIFSPEEMKIQRLSGENGKKTLLSIFFQPDDGFSKLQLEIELFDAHYPNAYPRVLMDGDWRGSGQLQEGAGTALHIEIIKFLSDLTKGDPMVFEIYGFVQGVLPSMPDGLSTKICSGESSLLLPHLEGGDNIIKKSRSSHSERTTKSGRKEERKESSRSRHRNSPKQRRPREKSFFWSRRPLETPPAIAYPKLSATMEKTRKCLPAAKAREEFLLIMKEADKGGRVVLVTGETGCGKTTQIPQFILEEAPADSKIVVAQPRRLAATGVAGRVADERGEDGPGKKSVGYVVRGATAMCNSTRLMFCTTGVLLRQLQSEGALDCISHILIDEVHERHLDTDVLLGILKSCLATTPHLKVVLMSATLDADRFAAYWGKDTPRMHIPGFTYPVKDYFLEDVLSLTGYIPPKKGKKKKNQFNNPGGYRRRKQSPWADSERSDEENDEGEEDESVATSATSSSGKTNLQAPSIPIEDLVKRVNESDIDYDMLAVLVGRLLQGKTPEDDGSILVFLPGTPEIGKAETSIRRIVKSGNMSILPLHGGLQPQEQQKVFVNARYGMTKVILSTNVAETSITIPDCTIVIDTCKEKQSSYDPSNRMPLLVERFAARDSLKQRRGRAGRVRSGTCYKLISRSTHDKLPEHGTPEIRRCALDQTLLSLLFLGVERGSGDFLNNLLDPPSQKAIDAAICSLERLGAVSVSNGEDRQLALTPLGMHLAGIPAPPSVGKILVMGCLMRCRKAALAIAAGMSVGRSPFLKVDVFRNSRGRKGEDEEESLEEFREKKVIEARLELFKSVGNSDLAMLAAAYMQWDAVGGGGGQKRQFCESLSLSINGMRDMKKLVSQLDNSLCSAGFFASKEADSHVNSWRIIRSCIVAALAPSQIVRVERPGTKYAETMEGAIEKDGNSRELKFFSRGDENGSSNLNKRYHGIAEERVFVHPASANFSIGNYSCPWLVYHELVRTSKPFLRDATECTSYALLLFGGKLDVQASEELVIVDGYIRLSANARIGALIGGLRKKVDELLSEKIANPSSDIVASIEMKIIVSLIKTDGLGT